MEAAVYIHIPFCLKKCLYCDFTSFPAMEGNFKAYKDAVTAEIRNTAELSQYAISSVFIGGGTPTVLPPEYLLEILKEVLRLNINKDAEITVEANPKTLSPEMLEVLRKSGVNRLSIGLQSSRDKILATIGRIHNYRDFLINYEDARKTGFDNINVDMMMGLPGQPPEDFAESLKEVAALAPEHISVYSLIIEEGTPFYEQYERGLIILPNEDEERQMYYAAREILAQKGYGQYEISNFSKAGKESRHNMAYWTMQNYFGIGLGAHSYVGGARYFNTSDINEYIANSKEPEKIRQDRNVLSRKEKMEEFMFLGLRLTQGVSIQAFRKEFGVKMDDVYNEAIEGNIQKGLLERQGGFIRLSPKGMDLANQAMSDFLL